MKNIEVTTGIRRFAYGVHKGSISENVGCYADIDDLTVFIGDIVGRNSKIRLKANLIGWK